MYENEFTSTMAVKRIQGSRSGKGYTQKGVLGVWTAPPNPNSYIYIFFN